MKPLRCVVLLLTFLFAAGGGAVATAQPGQDMSDIELRDRVKSALKNGCEYLRRAQNPDGSWGGTSEQFSEFRVGFTSLALLALINSDIPVQAEHVQRGLEYLRANGEANLSSRGVYEGSLMLMALCAAEQYERDIDRIRRLAFMLERTQCTNGTNSGLWGYGLVGLGGQPGSNGEDRSNGQFAVLALRDAVYAGVEIDRSVWQRTHDHWLQFQDRSGGWGYNPGDAPRGSMTAAGLSTLAITSRMLQDDSDVDASGRPDCCVLHPPEDAFERGRKWMESNFSVTTNVGAGQWHYYYLYGLERAGRLSGVRFFGEHDWYRAGARYLVSAQQADGHWATRRGQSHDRTLSTSYALMFLSKGLSRVVVNKLDYTSTAGREDVRGDWNRHPLDVTNLIDLIDGSPGWPPRLTSQVLSLSRLSAQNALIDMNQAPVLYISGKDAPPLTDEHIKWLRDYVDEGGFIFAMANCQGGSFDQGFREIVSRMFPQGDASLQRLQADHPVFRSEYLLNSDNIELHGVDFGCRTAIIYSPQDYACLWQKWMHHAPRQRHENLTSSIIRGTRVGVNVLAYATGREPPEKLNDAMTRKKDNEARIQRGLLEIAQLRYEGTWDIAPKALTNLLQGLNETVGMAVSSERRTIPITLPELTRFPIAYMHGRYRFQLQPQERDALRDYLSRGAVLFADACCGSDRFDQSFRDLMKQMYPDNPLKPIPRDHELFTEAIGHRIDQVQRRMQIPGERTASLQTRIETGPPVLEGIEIDGRYVVIYSRYDISCALENQASLACDGYVEQDAMRLAINIVLYAMLQDISWSDVLRNPDAVPQK